MHVGFKITKLTSDGFTVVKPVKLLSTGPVLVDEEFLVHVAPDGGITSAWKKLEHEFVLAKPRRLPVNYRVPCMKHVAKVAQHIAIVPQERAGEWQLNLLGRPITSCGIYIPREHEEKLFRNYIYNGELYRLARDLHRVDVRLSTTAGYNFELVKDAITNGATPVNFESNGTSMSAFFVMGSEWVHTVSSIPELNFGIGVVETSFIDFFKGIVMPYIETE